MPSVKEYAITGMMMQCDQGAMPMVFKATPKMFRLNGLDIGNELDKIPIMNIPTFGVCQALTKQANGIPVPCMPVVSLWQDADTAKIGGAKILLKKSCINCLSGKGKIEFK